MVKELTLFLFLIIAIFFITRELFKKFYLIFVSTFKNESIAYVLISILFLPGTALHELSHFLMATIFMLRVYDFTLLPQKKGNMIKMGSVVYEKKDLVRSVIIGIAPLFGGLFFFFFLSYFNLFPAKSLLLNLIIAYLIFTVSSTMFSSKQDLKDLIYTIPFILLLIFFLYIFNLNPLFYLQGDKKLLLLISEFFKRINMYLLFSLIINLFLLFLLSLIMKLKKI